MEQRENRSTSFNGEAQQGQLSKEDTGTASRIVSYEINKSDKFHLKCLKLTRPTIRSQKFATIGIKRRSSAALMAWTAISNAIITGGANDRYYVMLIPLRFVILKAVSLAKSNVKSNAE